MVRRLASVTAMIEALEARYAAGEAINHDLHLSMIQTSVRLANTIGLNRKQKNIPDLETYLGSKRNRCARWRVDCAQTQSSKGGPH